MAHEDESTSSAEMGTEAGIVAGDTLFHLLGVPIPPFAIFQYGYRAWGRVVKRIPHNCTSRADLYRIGAKMIKSPRERVTAVSTIANEDFPFLDQSSVADEHVRRYFRALHRIGYQNRFGSPRRRVRLLRYADLNDPEKCQEALSLLYNGADVEIRHSQVPVEFLIADRSSTLVGFPAQDALFGGFHSYDHQQCKAMASWIESYGSKTPRGGVTTPTEFVGLRDSLGFGSHDDGCLCNAVGALGDSGPSELSAAAFDRASEWYGLLYEHVEAEKFYGRLLGTSAIREARTNGGRSAFLDVGCGPGFGASVIGNQFEYWGLDVSESMIKRAKRRNVQAFAADAIAALLDVDERAKEFNRRAPKHFSVIACQGNTFDFFLGAVQKALALFLFDERLSQDGVLLFSGHGFSRQVDQVTRSLAAPGKVLSIQYDLDWKGDFCDLRVRGHEGVQDARVVMHPTSKDWLKKILSYMGYEEVDLGINWYPPGDAEPYYLWAFRRRKGRGGAA